MLLKLMLTKLVKWSRKDWDEYLPYLDPLCIQRVPKKSTGFFLFQLLYEQRVQGPLDVLKESWTGEAEEGSSVHVAEYVLAMRQCLQEMSELVQRTCVRHSQGRNLTMTFMPTQGA